MLDLIQIQDIASGITLFEYQGPSALIDEGHALIFSGFLSAIECIAGELRIGILTQISTDTHHCVIHRVGKILVVVIFDSKENEVYWKRKVEKIAQAFADRYTAEGYSPNNTDRFAGFSEDLKKLIK
jgi:hypothetical protein